MAEQFAIVTGTSSGIGLSLARELAMHEKMSKPTPGWVKGAMHEKVSKPKAS